MDNQVSDLRDGLETAFEIMYRLDVPVRNDIYDYIVKE